MSGSGHQFRGSIVSRASCCTVPVGMNHLPVLYDSIALPLWFFFFFFCLADLYLVSRVKASLSSEPEVAGSRLCRLLLIKSSTWTITFAGELGLPVCSVKAALRSVRVRKAATSNTQRKKSSRGEKTQNRICGIARNWNMSCKHSTLSRNGAVA